jgi:alpha-1,6-mannosyltransferase
MTRPAVLLAAIGVALVALVAAGLAILTAQLDDSIRVTAFMTTICIAGALWLLAVMLVRRGSLPPRVIWLVLGVAFAMRVMTLIAPPLLSSDIYRYVWDGRVQLAGINPYRYVPAAPELSSVRDDTVYPQINRADYAHTLYQPAAQAIFAIAAVITPGVFGMKLMMAMFDLLAIGTLALLLRIAGRDPAELLIYAWLPLPVWEFAGNAHIDAAAAGLLSVALLVASRGRSIWTGILLAVASLTKLLPAVVLPAFWRPRDWRLPLAFAAATVVLYALYASAGFQVFGFLGGYSSEEGIENGHGIFLLQLIDSVVSLPGWAIAVYVALALMIIGLIAIRFAFSGRLPVGRGPRIVLIARQSAILGAAVLVAVSPHYPWYFGWLAPLACLAPLPAVLWMLAAAPLLAHGAVEYLVVPAAVYAPAALLALLDLRHLPVPREAVRSL